MYNLYYSGTNLLVLGAALLVTWGITFLVTKRSKKERTKQLVNNWQYVILAIILYIFNAIAWFTNDANVLAGNLIVLVTIVNLVGIKKPVVFEKQLNEWAAGISFILAGLMTVSNYSNWMYIEYSIIGILWIYFKIFYKKEIKVKYGFRGLMLSITIVTGIILYMFGSYVNTNTAHIRTNDYSVKLGKHSATISGYATPNAKVRTYLNGSEETPAEHADSDGYFEFTAQKPGKWVVKVTKNGKTDSDYTYVKKSAAWKKYQAKIEADRAIRHFEAYYQEAAEAIDNIGVDEYNTWSNVNDSGVGGSIDSTLENVQEKHKKDLNTAKLDLILLQSELKVLEDSGNSDYDTYHQYYRDLKKFYNITVNPPAGDIDNFGDEYLDTRSSVSDDIDEY